MQQVTEAVHFLGHDIRVHRQYYHLPQETLQLTKMSKVLLAVEKGRLSQYKGQSLDNIEIDPEEKIDSLQEDMSSDEDESVHSTTETTGEDGHATPETSSSLPATSSSAPLDQDYRGNPKRKWEDSEVRAAERHMMCFIHTCKYTYDVVLMASSSQDLQHVLERFAAECEAAGMRISTSKSEAMVLDRKRVACPLRVGGEVLPQVEEFKYLGVLFTSEGKMEREIDRRIGAASAVMRKRKRSHVSVEGAAVLLCFVSGRPEGSSLYQLWTLVLQTVHHLILGPVCFIRRLLLSPVWRKIQNKSWTADSQSDQQCTKIYTELYITEGQSEEVNTQHEVRQLETANKMKTLHETPFKCHDIFKALPDQQKHIRVVLTNGVAGVGKTFSVQKFTLDWAEGLENQDKSSVNVLLTNLIKGNLLPSALVWITSRPAAANQIPPEYVDRLTEVRGFTDAQKEEYFRRRFSDEDLSSRIISHIKTSRTLHIMCQIPVFCWITATVLDHMLTTDQRGELPKTLTDLYSHFLLVQTKRKKQKYDEGHETSPQELMEADRKASSEAGEAGV
ncbi:hypothetical protein L3Q82_000089 [Scortum barcoo]|uniref:Uncharacterized protein n=1 Tax=Scortum barcoo TaxID=214431 RepID=A0ACB8X9K5_9TELE|nr:hypothetical protein L3Q82_000089 [Scortum barcoo]